MIRGNFTKRNSNITGSLSSDHRGQNEPPNELSQKMFVTIHLCCRKCRYTGAEEIVLIVYLEGFNLKKSVYDLCLIYLSYAIENGYREVSETIYYQQLEELKIGFHQPHKDQCSWAGFCKLTDHEKAEKQNEYDLHIKRKNTASDQKKLHTEASKNPQLLWQLFSTWRLFCTHHFLKPNNCFTAEN